MAEKEPKNGLSKGEVQNVPANRMPVPELDTESAAEIVYGSDTNLAERSAFNKKNS